jgi:hypothetical protein
MGVLIPEGWQRLARGKRSATPGLDEEGKSTPEGLQPALPPLRRGNHLRGQTRGDAWRPRANRWYASGVKFTRLPWETERLGSRACLQNENCCRVRGRDVLVEADDEGRCGWSATLAGVDVELGRGGGNWVRFIQLAIRGRLRWGWRVAKPLRIDRAGAWHHVMGEANMR